MIGYGIRLLLVMEYRLKVGTSCQFWGTACFVYVTLFINIIIHCVLNYHRTDVYWNDIAL